eukprot:m.310328 g.310328  ORF g.310328 m.310328 type:complete len:544 (+) comp50935_c0_seq1:226-1857(+)
MTGLIVILLQLTAFFLVYVPLLDGQDARHYYNDKVTATDGLLPESALRGLAEFVAHYSVWAYQFKDPYQDPSAYSSFPVNLPNIQWLSHLDVALFETTDTWNLLRNVANAKGKSYRPYSISSFLIRRLDPVKVGHNDCRHPDDRVITVFLTKGWLKNDYGELLLSDTEGGVAASFMPYRGRVVVWDCDVPYLFRPPGMAYKQAQYGILLRLTTSDDVHERGLKEFEDLQKFFHRHNFLDFPVAWNKPVAELNMSDYLTRKYEDRAGNRMAVYDNILSDSELSELRSYLISYHDSYHYQIHDESIEEDSDNVQWVSGLPTSLFLKSSVWGLTEKIAAHISNKTGWFPYDVALNIVRGVDYTRIHKDCEDYESELTMLIYLNPDYDLNDHGETVFLEEVPPKPGDPPHQPGQEVYELLAAVRPRYGRFCIFHGVIPHSARPPSIAFNGARYTFAVKLSSSLKVAKAKALQEILEGGYSRERRSLDMTRQNLLDSLTVGQFSEGNHENLPLADFLSVQFQSQAELLLKERYEKRLKAMNYFKSFSD